MMKQICCVSLSIILLYSTTASLLIAYEVQVESEPLTLDETLKRYDEFMDLVAETRAAIDRSQFEIEALIERLNFDETEIVDFVTNEIAFEAYAGALRGAKGTLRSAAGNSLDQSILLAKLLKDAGFDARIIRAELSEGQILALWNSMKPRQWPSQSVFANEPQELSTVQGNDALNQGNELGISEAQKSAVKRSTEFITTQLATNDIALDVGAPSKSLMNELRNYFAVEYRLGPSDEWILEHPALPDIEMSADDFEAKELLSDNIPVELQHRFSFQAFASKRFGSKVSEEPIMNAWERPTANLAGEELTFTLAPQDAAQISENVLDNLPSADVSEEEQASRSLKGYLTAMAESKAEFYTPVFNGSVPPGAKVIDLQGNIVPADVSQQQAAALFRTIGGATREAVSSIASLGGSKDDQPNKATELLSVWVTYRFISPTGEVKEYRRSIFNAENQFQSRAPSLALMKAISFMLSTGQSNQAYLLDRHLDYLAKLRDPVKELLKENKRISAQALGRMLGSNPEFVTREYDLLKLFHGFDSWHSDESRIAYRSEPSLTAIEQDVIMAESPQFRVAVDIVSNEKRALVVEDGKLLLDPIEGMALGIWDTYVEHRFTDPSSVGSSALSGAGVRWSTFLHLDKAASGGSLAHALGPENVSNINQLAVSEQVRTALKQEIRDGFIVVIPDPSSFKEGRLGWWRINPETGTALGISQDQRGESFLSYVITLIPANFGGIIVGRFVQSLVFFLFCWAAIGARQGGYITGDEDLTNCVAGAGVVFAFGMKGPALNLAIISFIYGVFGPVTFS